MYDNEKLKRIRAMKHPEGIDCRCVICGDEDVTKPKVTHGHQNGKDFRYCKECMTSHRFVCGECGCLLWESQDGTNFVWNEDGPYCDKCRDPATSVPPECSEDDECVLPKCPEHEETPYEPPATD
jgi:hypothetical protein